MASRVSGSATRQGPGSPEAHDLEEAEKGGLVPAADDGGRTEDEMVSLRGDGVGEGAAEGVGAEEDVRVGEEEEVGFGGEGGGLGHGIGFAEPAGGEGADVEGLDAGGGVHEGAGRVVGAVVDGHDVEVGVVLSEEGVEAGLDIGLFVMRGDDDGEDGEAGRGEVVRGEGEVGEGGEATGGGEDAGEPGGGKEPGDDGADGVCARHGTPPPYFGPKVFETLELSLDRYPRTSA